MDTAAGMEQPLGFTCGHGPDVHLGYGMVCAAWTGASEDPAPLFPVPGPGGPRSGHWSVDGTELTDALGPFMRLEQLS